MRLIRSFLLVAVVIAIVATATPALAAPASFERADVLLHAEGDQMPVLIVTGELPSSAELPADVKLSVPSGQQMQWVGEILGGPVADDPTVQYQSSTQGDTDVLSFTLSKARIAQAEILMPSAVSIAGEGKLAKLSWTPAEDIRFVRLGIRLPANSQISSATPGAQRQQGEQGWGYLVRTFENAKAGEPLTLEANYVGGTVPSTGGGTAATGAPQPNALPLPVLLVFAAVLVGVVALLMSKVGRSSAGRGVSDSRDDDDYDYDAEDAQPAQRPASKKKSAADSKSAAASKGRAPSKSAAAKATAPAATSGGAGAKTKMMIVMVVLVVFGVLFVTLAMTASGTKTTDSTGISKTVAGVTANATEVFPFRLQEGNDLEHESKHVFEAVETLPGIASLKILREGPALEVKFDSSKITKEQIEQALAQGGYGSATGGAGK